MTLRRRAQLHMVLRHGFGRAAQRSSDGVNNGSCKKKHLLFRVVRRACTVQFACHPYLLTCCI